MKKLKDKSERLLLGKIIEAEAESGNPDMKLVRECTDKIEATAGKLTDSEIEAKLAKITGAKKTTVTHARFKKRKLWVSVVAASLAVVMVTAAAATSNLWGWLTFPFTRDSGQLTEVPEGYVGIYTEADLDLIRNDPDGNFILMADIDLGGKEHTPIGDYLNPFDGMFNGNGHVISNFTINASGASIWETVSGEELQARWNAQKKKLNSGKYKIDVFNLPAYSIFGLDGRFDERYDNKTYEEYDMQYISSVGFFGDAGNATITGLGVENATVSVTDADYAAVGVIAGRAGYISACYVKDSTVTIGANTADVEAYANGREMDIFEYMMKEPGLSIRGCERVYSVSAGLLAGEVFAIDSCYTDGTLNASGIGSDNIDYSTLSAGSLAGYGGSAVSSYSTATVNIEGNVFRSQGMLGKACLTPCIVPTPVFETLVNEHMSGGYFYFYDINKRNDKDTKASFEKTLFCFYYLHGNDLEDLTSVESYISLEDIEYAFFIDGDGVRTMDSMCIISAMSTHYDRLQLMELLERLGDIDAIEQLYKDAGMRVGAICCYTPEGKEKAEFYEGFDFGEVWTMKNGMPVLKIFG
ncbi:MAG: hypothetical protein IIX44_05600 [Clostridia bacterium]|nr:hypothetical protein [Clostridia bacterium]